MPTAILPKTSPTPRLKRSTLLARQICLSIAQGNSLISTCKTLKISKPFVLDWLRSDPDFASHYSRAREDQADKYADEIVEISDRATVQDAHVARLKVDARKWVAAKLLPKKYGDRPAQVNVNTQINLMQVSIEDQRRIEEARFKLLQGDTNAMT